MTAVPAPLVSVVMPVYNGDEFLAEAIESILNQTFTDFEFIIVDDGSQDLSAEIVRGYMIQDDRVHFIQLDENMGNAFARNAGIAAANGVYIATMDCDDVSLPQRLERQAAFMESCPRIGVLGARTHYVDKDMNLLLSPEEPLQHALICINFIAGSFLAHPGTMFRRSLLAAVGNYCADYATAVDLHLYLRLLTETKTRFANTPEVLILYRLHDSNISRNLDADGRARRLRLRRWMLQQLWNNTPEATFERLTDARPMHTRSWIERWSAKRDYKRLASALIAKEWVDAEDRQLLLGHIDRLIGNLSPRLWQMFVHWRRHHFGR